MAGIFVQVLASNIGNSEVHGCEYSEGPSIVNALCSLLFVIRVNHSISFICEDFGSSLPVLIDIVSELELRGRLNPLQVFHEIIPALSHKVSAIAKAVPGFRQ
jgi:hypothetical protein